MKKKWIFFVAPPAAVLVIWGFGELVKHLWNWLVPGLLGWHPVTFWQALGVLLLCRILFGSWGSGGPQREHSKEGCWKRRMTDEERERIRGSAQAGEGATAAGD